MKNKKSKKKIGAAVAITAVVLAMFIVSSGPAIIADHTDAGPYEGEVLIYLNATDEGGSGVAETWYILDFTPPAQVTVPGVKTLYTGPFTKSEVGIYDIEYWSVDGALNEELPHNTATFEIVPLPDTIPPVTTIDIVGDRPVKP